MSIEFEGFIRTPFEVRAIRVTEENIEEVGEFIRTRVTPRHDGSIVVRTFRLFVGCWVVLMGDRDKVRIYFNDRTFFEQFVPANEGLTKSIADYILDSDETAEVPQVVTET